MWIAVASFIGCASNPPAQEAPKTAVTVQPVGKPREVVTRDHAGEVGQYRRQLERAEKHVKEQPDSIVPNLRLAELHSTLGRLEGGTAHFDAAAAAVEHVWARFPEHADVRRARASRLQHSHHFADALALLEGLDKPSDRAMRATLRFELGDYDRAVAELEALNAGARFPEPAFAGRLAVCLWKLGRFDEAEAQIAIAQEQYRGRDNWIRAWHHLLLGLMDLDRERLDDAMAHYAAAEKVFPGWWLVQEHIAEIHLEQGRPTEALPIYERVVAETNNPELIAAMADTLDALGRSDEASKTRTRAMQVFEEHLAHDAAAAGGHALEFFLEHGTPERSLALAKANAELRPNGEAKLLLADAMERNGLDGAKLRAEVAASGWYTSD